MAHVVSPASIWIRNLPLSHPELRLAARLSPRLANHVALHGRCADGTLPPPSHPAALKTELLGQAWMACSQPMREFARELDMAPGSQAPVPASVAGSVSLAAALVLHKLMGDTYAAALPPNIHP